ncbi:MAG: SPOR domain-containing protein [Prevotella sp.]|nr:SPOR domain-containing protein [Prevotella sp.]
METRQYQIIRKVLVVLPFYLFTFLPLSAQTFTQRIQQPTEKGRVTIHQNAAIDQLVNTTVLSTERPNASANKNDHAAATGTSAKSTPDKSNTATAATAASQQDDDVEGDASKKVMRGGHKVMGYRVQAFAGGNSRKDRQQAEYTGNSIRQHFPNVPVYVHFYSPRWICRVGNYRTYEEAHQMLTSLRNLGYREASIVKGKITVAY